MTIIKPLPQPNSTHNENVENIGIYAINEDLSVIFANCLDKDNNLVSPSNWFYYKGDNKNVPFTLTKTEIAKIKSTE